MVLGTRCRPLPPPEARSHPHPRAERRRARADRPRRPPRDPAGRAPRTQVGRPHLPPLRLQQGLLAAVVDDFYDRFDAVVIDPNPAPRSSWGTRERERTRLAIDFRYDDPLAGIILGRLAREPEVAGVEARRLARHIDAAARNIEIGQQRGEIATDLDAGLAGAMVLGGLRQAIGAALARPAPPPRAELTEQIWRFIAAAVRYSPATDEETPDGR